VGCLTSIKNITPLCGLCFPTTLRFKRHTGSHLQRSICLVTLLGFLLIRLGSTAQPYVDVVSLSNQHFVSGYKNSKADLYAENSILNVFLPLKVHERHLFLVRIFAEQLKLQRTGENASFINVYSLSPWLGTQLVSADKKWKCTAMIIPKIISDMRNNTKDDYQLGGLVLFVYSNNVKAHFKAGLYYNKDFFGNFFIPVGGIDYRFNSRLRVFGTLPINYRFECKLDDHFRTGLAFRAYQRSYRLDSRYENGYIRARENQLRLYVEANIAKNLVLSADIYRTLRYSFTQKDHHEQDENIEHPVFSPFNGGFGANLTIFYRVTTLDW
jgi:hypothetical protein